MPIVKKQLINLSESTKALCLGVLLLSTLLVVYADTWRSMVSIWWRSDTFMHGFIVLPTAVWLVWQSPSRRQTSSGTLDIRAVGFMVLCGAVWMLADLGRALVIQQYAVVGMLISSLGLLFGLSRLRQFAFPAGFLLFMVPVGEDLVPPLMEFTAHFVVAALQGMGITVYREGLHFTLPTGSWSVIEACSGIRYLIASLTLGAVYAYLNYQSVAKRVLFMLVSALVPILANGMRALLIVLMGHYSGMRLATGFDHIVYGWLFFGLVIWLLFTIGHRWRDPQPTAVAVDLPISVDSHAPSTSVTVSLALGCLLLWPLLANALIHRQTLVPAPSELFLPAPWQEIADPGWGWRPRFPGTQYEQLTFWRASVARVGVFQGGFANDTGRGELINSQHWILPETDHRWRVTEEASIQLAGGFDVEQTVLDQPSRQLVIWRWYRIGDLQTANRYRAKWAQMLKRLRGDPAEESMLLLYVETSAANRQVSSEQLQQAAQQCCLLQSQAVH